MQLRNLGFEWGLLKQTSYEVPVICVGNITIGGTGKTPHTEMLLRMLMPDHRVAVLSRGYKRKSRGFRLADSKTPMREIGDEPWQMKQKFPQAIVAVDTNRRRGIRQLLTAEATRDVDVILLDDAYQHRYVHPGLNILLTDYHRLITDDALLPAGRLREPVSAKERANVVIVTKCPKDLKPMEYRVITKAMNLYPYQQLFFSTIEYSDLQPLFGGDSTVTLSQLSDHHVLLLTGIASPQQMTHDLQPLIPQLTPLTFSDHHDFKEKDIALINDTFASLPEPRLIITTEKDATRLKLAKGLNEEVRNHLYVLPINVCILQEQAEVFNQQIIDYVHKNSRNSILVKRKDDHKSQDSNHSGNRPRTISFRDN